MHEREEIVGEVRADSRRLAREWGFLERTLAATQYSPSAVHALVEIAAAPGITAAELSDVLLLDRSSVSRLLRGLADEGVVQEAAGTVDRRQKQLSLTVEGKRAVAGIDAYGATQVRAAFGRLGATERETVRRGLRWYAESLEAARKGTAPAAPSAEVVIDDRSRPGDLGAVIALHGREYSEISGFGIEFESLVAGDLAEFLRRDDPDSRLWIARGSTAEVLGSVAMDLSAGPERGHLRWFLLSAGARGLGLGRKLLDTAVSHADACGVRRTELWTFKGLDAARTMYEKHGFVLDTERPGTRWGSTVIEQRFHRPGPLA